jgi:acyl-CoA synthetase (AMP-forming)/AMP-acid ligase II
LKTHLKAETVFTRWCNHAEQDPDKEAVIWTKLGQEPVRWTWGNLIAKGFAFGEILRSTGIKPGHVCAIICRHNPLFYPLYAGVKAVGAIPAVLAYPNPRLHPEKFKEGLRACEEIGP